MKLKRDEYFKLTKPDGFDFYSGKTINYRDNLGKDVAVKDLTLEPKLCSPAVLHASKVAVNCFVGARIPCSMFIVQGKPVTKDSTKCGFRTLHVDREIEESKFEQVFGFNYAGAARPLDPRLILLAKIDDKILQELRVWASVWDSVGASVWASVRDSVGASVRASVRDSVGASLWASVRASVGASVWASVRDSVGDSVWDSVWDSEAAYVGTLFPIKKWKYTEKLKVKGYPFQSCVNLLKLGLVPVRANDEWFLLGGPKMSVQWRGKL